jgi:Rrf2 family protein
MKIGKSAGYALHAMQEMALAGDEAVTVARIARRYGIPQAALAKVVQQLVRAGLVLGTRGVGGGCRLARRASEVSVLDVVAAFEPVPPARSCLISDRADAACPVPEGCALRQLFDEADEVLRSTLASVSLATLARRTRALAATTGGRPRPRPAIPAASRERA